MKNPLDKSDICWYNGTNPTKEELKTSLLTMDKIYREQEIRRRGLILETLEMLEEHPELWENYIIQLRYPKIISMELTILG